MAVNKHWDHPSSGRKPSGTRELRRVLILCEDSKSSCLYFKKFPAVINKLSAIVEAVGTGMNTDSLVREAIRRKETASKEQRPYNEVWCVFDRDSFPSANYNNAFDLARNHRIHVAWSNEAFELWYLLHFNYHDTGISRNDYKAKLKNAGIEYGKSDENIYDKVIAKQKDALRNAKRLEKYWWDIGKNSAHGENPSTNVHKLVVFLNELNS